MKAVINGQELELTKFTCVAQVGGDLVFQTFEDGMAAVRMISAAGQQCLTAGRQSNPRPACAVSGESSGLEGGFNG